MSKFYVIDGNSLLFRCFYSTFRPGLPLMQSKDGTPTNAIYGFAQMIGHIRKGLKDGDRMIVCFDTGHPTFRSQEIEAYKAQRKPIEPALKTQIPMAHELLDKMGIEHAEMLGYEGDDVAGSLAKLGQKKGDEVTLFTSDKDFLQLLDDHIQIHALKKGLTDVIEYTKDNVAEKFGCRADQIVDFKALAGDPSDNYKGVPGIGIQVARARSERRFGSAMVDRQFHGDFRNADRTHHATAGIQQALVLRVRRTGACGTGVRTTLVVRFTRIGHL